jgi:hypothetical protein
LERDDGKKELPLRASILVADYLHRAAPAAGVQIAQGIASDYTISAIHSGTGSEQGEGRAEDRARNPAQFFKDTDDADLYTQEGSDEARAEGSVSGGGRIQVGDGAVSCGLKLWVGLWGVVFYVYEKAGGDDETRTRDLCRDRATFSRQFKDLAA